MRRDRNLAGLAIGSFLSLTGVGCGADVIVEDPESSARNGSSGPSGSSEPGGSTGTVGSNDPATAACRDICARYERAGCPQPGCAEKCRRDHDDPACRPERDALGACVLADGADEACAFPASCTLAYVDYVECAGEATGALPGDCTPALESRLPGGVCSAFIECQGIVLTQTCFGDEDDGFDCECAEDGVVVGTCREVDDGCDVAGACCETVVTRPGSD